jgi:S1-C subfamily serine protease
VFCPQCGVRTPDGANFCHRCGAVLPHEKGLLGEKSQGVEAGLATGTGPGGSRSWLSRCAPVVPALFLGLMLLAASGIFLLTGTDLPLFIGRERYRSEQAFADGSTPPGAVFTHVAPTVTPAQAVTATAVTATVPTSTPNEAEVISRVMRSVVQIRTERPAGTGFMVRQDGTEALFLTNAHVVVGVKSVSVVTADGTAHPATVLARDEDADLAILSVKGLITMPPLPFGDSDKLRQGESVVVIGYPLSSQLLGDPTVTRGIVSARREMRGNQYIQTNAAMNPGNSGGPVINTDGAVVGVATMKLANAEGINFAIPSNRVSKVLDQLLVASKTGVALAGDVWKTIATPTVFQTTYDISKHGSHLDPIYERLVASDHLWEHRAFWTGREMFVWGEGGAGRYDPATDAWRPVSLNGAPSGRTNVLLVWTGKEVIVWSAGTGGRYDPSTDSWQPIATTGAPKDSFGLTAVWTGKEMILWGMSGPGAAYNPTTDSWRSLPTEGAPTPRIGHSAIWTGREMLIWGGMSTYLPLGSAVQFLNDGARYNPETNTWSLISTNGAPAPRYRHLAVWTGQEMLIVGGQVAPAREPVYFNDGARYDPSTDTWSAIPPTDLLPKAGYLLHMSAVWTGHDVIIWGGFFPSKAFANYSGGYHQLIQARFNPRSDIWSPLPSVETLERAVGHDTVWTGKEMIVFGWFRPPANHNPDIITYIFTGARYIPPAHFDGEAMAKDSPRSPAIPSLTAVAAQPTTVPAANPIAAPSRTPSGTPTDTVIGW